MEAPILEGTSFDFVKGKKIIETPLDEGVSGVVSRVKKRIEVLSFQSGTSGMSDAEISLSAPAQENEGKLPTPKLSCFSEGSDL